MVNIGWVILLQVKGPCHKLAKKLNETIIPIPQYWPNKEVQQSTSLS